MSYDLLWLLFLAALILMIKPGPYMMTFISLATMGDWRSILVIWISYLLTASALYFVFLKTLSFLPVGVGLYFLFFKCGAAMLFINIGISALRTNLKTDKQVAKQRVGQLSKLSILARGSSGVMLALSNPYEFVWIITVIPTIMKTIEFSYVDIYVIRSVVIWADILVQGAYILPILYFRNFMKDEFLQRLRTFSSYMMIGIGAFILASLALRWDLEYANLLS